MSSAHIARAEQAEWLHTAVGQSLDPDGRYGLQCVDLADSYCQTLFGVPWHQSLGAVSGARELMHTASPAYFDKIWNDPNNAAQFPAMGDIIVWAGAPGNPWGHVAVVIHATSQSVTVVQQDGFAEPLVFVDGNWYSRKPAHRAELQYSNPGTGMVSGWLRLKAARVRNTGAVNRGWGGR